MIGTLSVRAGKDVVTNGLNLAGAAGIEKYGEEAATEENEALYDYFGPAADGDRHDHPQNDGGDESGANGVSVVEADSRRGAGGRGGRGGGHGAEIVGGVLNAGRPLKLGDVIGFGRGIGKQGLAATVTEAGVGRQLGATGTKISHDFSVS